jgi:hypothetical protein
VFRIPFVQPLPELVLRFEPDAFGVEYQAVLKYIFTQYESLLGSSLQLFPKAGRDKYTSLCIRLCFNIA